MRNLYGLTSVLVCAAIVACSPAEPPADDDQRVDLDARMQALQDRRAELAVAEARMDIETASGIWAQDAILHIADRSPVIGRMLIRDFYHEFFGGDVVAFERESHEVRIAESGEFAYSLGQQRFHIMRGGEDYILTGKYLAVWEYLDGDWTLVAVSVTQDSDAPEPLVDGED